MNGYAHIARTSVSEVPRPGRTGVAPARVIAARPPHRGAACRSVWRAGASGCPTTTSRPSDVLQHLDRGAVQPGRVSEVMTCCGRARDRAALGEVDHPVQVGQDRVDVVGDHHDGHALLPADPADERGDGGLVGQVEAVQRLVEQQQFGPPHQRLRDQQPLLLAAGALPDRPVRVGRRADQLDHLGDPRAAARRCAVRAAPAAARPSGRRPSRAGRCRCRACAGPGRSCGAAAGSRRGGRPARGRRRGPAPRRPRAAARRAATLTRVDLPTPLGPSTATNSPRRATGPSSTPDHRVRPPTRTAGAAQRDHRGTVGAVRLAWRDGAAAASAGDGVPDGRGAVPRVRGFTVTSRSPRPAPPHAPGAGGPASPGRWRRPG